MGGVSRTGIQYIGLAIIGVVVAGALGYCTGKRDGQTAEQLRANSVALRQAREVRATATTAAVQAVSAVRQGQPAVDHARALAGIVGATTLTIRVTPSAAPELVTVPAQVVARMVEDSLHILRLQGAVAALTALVVADSNVIDRQADRIRLLEGAKTPRCQAKCGATITVVTIAAAGYVAKNIDAILNLFR